MDQLTKIISETLEALVDESGWSPPINLAVVGSNGAVLVARYAAGGESLECEIVAESYDDRGIATPWNMFFTNTNGDAALVLLETDGATPKLFH